MAKHRAVDVDLDDEPSYEPMRGLSPSGLRRNPSSDDKKVRRQMARSQEQSMKPKTAAADTSINRETELLQAMAAAGDLATQAKLAAELESLRSDRIAAARHAASLDLDATPHLDRWSHNPNPASLRTSMASDWLMDVEVPEHTAQQRDQKMVAEASLWFTSVSGDIKADVEEFTVQAQGMSAYLASQYGEDAAAAQRTFLDHIEQLAGRKLAINEGQDDVMPPDSQVAGSPVETKPMDTVDAPADTGPAEVDHSTPSGDASLSEGNSPEGEQSSSNAVSDSAVQNNHGDSGGSFPPVDNSSPFNDSKPMTAALGSKRRALLEREAAKMTCRACGEEIEKHGDGYRHSGYKKNQGHQRNHIAAPAGKSATRKVAEEQSGDTAQTQTHDSGGPDATMQPQSMVYSVEVKHPDVEYKEKVAAPNAGTAMSIAHGRFPVDSGVVTDGVWTVKKLDADKDGDSKKTAAAPTPDGLNAGVDFQDNPNPEDSVSLGPGNEGEFPAPADGNPQIMTNPTATAALYEVGTDRRICAAKDEHEMAFLATGGQPIWVDGDGFLIAAEIAHEPYVVGPVRQAYVGIDEVDPGQEGVPSTADDFNDYGTNPMEGRQPYVDPYSDEAAASEFPPPGSSYPPGQHAPTEPPLEDLYNPEPTAPMGY